MPITAKATLFSNYNVIASAAKQSRSIKDCRVRLRPLAMTLRISLYFLRKKCYTRYKLIFSEVTGITMDEKEKKEQEQKNNQNQNQEQGDGQEQEQDNQQGSGRKQWTR